MPTITGVSWPTVNGNRGLYTDGTASPIQIQGTGLSQGMACTVTKSGTGTWNGSLSSTYSASLTFTRGDGMGGTEEVTVTVGSGANKSPNYPATAPIGGST